MTRIAVLRLDFKTRQYLKGSLWFLPLLGGIAGAVLGLLEPVLTRGITVPLALEYSASTASSLLSAIVGATAALTGFVVTVSVLVVQMATNTLSARYMRLWYRDKVLQVLLAMLVGTFTFSFTLLAGVEENSVPHVGVSVTGVLMAADMFLFLFFLDRFVHRLRPVAVAAIAAAAGLRAFDAAVRATSGPHAPEVVRGPLEFPDEPTMVVRTRGAGSIQAIDATRLIRFAQERRCTLVLNHAAGDFVPAGAPVIRVYGGEPDDERDENRLRQMVVLGVERTIEQDPAFAVRIMVDIAVKALSPAVNDPTTAVQVIDHLEDLLREVGQVDLSDTGAPLDDMASGLVVPVRRWADYLTLSVTEIRQYGDRSIQVVRRLRAMLEELAESVLPERREAVLRELARLDEAVGERWRNTVDLDLAVVADRQGVGGPASGAHSS